MQKAIRERDASERARGRFVAAIRRHFMRERCDRCQKHKPLAEIRFTGKLFICRHCASLARA